ncbi:hypothetical protein [Pontibacter mucosus]|nr:hypothetical protein [Pontibacter mucosus]
MERLLYFVTEKSKQYRQQPAPLTAALFILRLRLPHHLFQYLL